MEKQEPFQVDFYSSLTLSDHSSMAVLGEEAFPSSNKAKKDRHYTRRAFLALSGIVLGASGLGAGYAASHLSALHSRALMSSDMSGQRHTASTAQPAPTRPALPTQAEVTLSFTHHQQTVRSVTWSPDGKMLASGADDHHLLVWDINGAIATNLPQDGSVRAVAWSPDGQQLVIGAANSIIFLDPFTGSTFARFKLHATTKVTSLAWSPQQPLQAVSGATDNRAIVWDAAAYRPTTVFTSHTAPIEAAAWAADGQTIATSSFGGVVRVWNGASGMELHGLYLDTQVPKRALAFAPSGDELAVGGDDGLIRLWNSSTCQQQGQGTFGNQCLDMPHYLRRHTQPVQTLSWSPSGRLLASGTEDGVLAIWSPMRSDAPVLTIPHQAPVVASTWSPDGGQIATASANTVRIWRLS